MSNIPGILIGSKKDVGAVDDAGGEVSEIVFALDASMICCDSGDEATLPAVTADTLRLVEVSAALESLHVSLCF